MAEQTDKKAPILLEVTHSWTTTATLEAPANWSEMDEKQRTAWAENNAESVGHPSETAVSWDATEVYAEDGDLIVEWG